jgi:hypothetical protein
MRDDINLWELGFALAIPAFILLVFIGAHLHVRWERRKKQRRPDELNLHEYESWNEERGKERNKK